MGKIKKIFSKINGLYLTLILSALGAIFSFLVTFLLTHYLGDNEEIRASLYGKIQYYLGIITTLSIFLKFGFVSFIVKDTQYSISGKQTFSRSFFLFDVLSILIFPIFFVISYFALNQLDKNSFLIIALFIASFSFSLVSLICASLLSKKHFKGAIFFESVLPKIVQLVVFAVFIVLKQSNFLTDYFVLIFLSTYAIIALPFLLMLVRKTSIKFSKTEIISICTFFLLALTGNFGNSLIKVFQGEFYISSDEAMQIKYDAILGNLALALQIVSMGMIFVGAIANIAKPQFAIYSRDSNNDALVKFFTKTIRLSGFIAIPFMIAFIMQPKNVMSFFGISSFPIFLVILSIYGLILALGGPCGTLLEMSGHEKIELLAGIANLVLFIALSFALRNITIYALPISLLFGTLLGKIINVISIKLIYKRNPIDKKTVLTLVIFTIICICVFRGLNRIENPYLWIISNCIIGCALIVSGFMMSPYKDDKYFFFKKGLQ